MLYMNSQYNSTSGKEDQIASDYVIHEQPIQSTLLQKRTEDNLELLKT